MGQDGAHTGGSRRGKHGRAQGFRGGFPSARRGTRPGHSRVLTGLFSCGSEFLPCAAAQRGRRQRERRGDAGMEAVRPSLRSRAALAAVPAARSPFSPLLAPSRPSAAPSRGLTAAAAGPAPSLPESPSPHAPEGGARRFPLPSSLPPSSQGKVSERAAAAAPQKGGESGGGR